MAKEEHLKGYSIKFNLKSDADVIARLDNVPNRAEYLRYLIREDLKINPIEIPKPKIIPLTKNDVREKTLELMSVINKYLDEN